MDHVINDLGAPLTPPTPLTPLAPRAPTINVMVTHAREHLPAAALSLSCSGGTTVRDCRLTTALPCLLFRRPSFYCAGGNTSRGEQPGAVVEWYCGEGEANASLGHGYAHAHSHAHANATRTVRA